MTEYKVGDRVRFFGSEGCAPDTGTVTLVDPDEILAKWDSNGQEQHFFANDCRFQKIHNDFDELTARVARLEEIVAKLSHISNRNIRF